MESEIKVRVSVEADKAKKSLGEITDSVLETGKACEQASSQMNSITSVCKAQSDYLNKLKKAYVDVAAAEGENSDNAQKLAGDIKKTSAELKTNKDRVSEAEKSYKKLTGELEDTETSFKTLFAEVKKGKKTISDFTNEVLSISSDSKKASKGMVLITDACEEQEKALESLKKAYVNVVAAEGKNSDSAKKLAKEIKSTSKSLKELEGKVSDAEGEMKKLTKESTKAKDTFKNVAEAGKKIGSTIAKGIKTAVVAVAGLITALLALSASSAEFREEQAKLTTAFKSVGSSAQTAETTYKSFFRVLGDSGQAVEAASLLAQITTNEQELAEWTNTCQGIYATFGDSLPIEGLVEAANESIKTGQATGVLCDALNWTTISAETVEMAFGDNKKALKAYQTTLKKTGSQEEAYNAAMKQCTTAEERAYATRMLLNGTYGEAATIYETDNAALLEYNESLYNLQRAQAAIGQAMLPVNTALNEFAASLMDELTPTIQEFVDEHGEDLKNILNDVAAAIGNVVQWITDNWDTITQIAPIILIIAAALGVVSAIIAVVNAVMAASPVTWIILAVVVAIAALIAIIVLCVQHWDEIKAAGAAAWEWIKNAWHSAGEWFAGIVESIKGVFSNIGEWFSNLFSNAWSGIQTAWSSVSDWFSGIWDKIKGVFSTVGTFFKDKFTDAWNNITGIFSNWGTFFQELVDKVKNIFSDIGSSIGSAVSGLVNNAIHTVCESGVNIINSVIELLNKAITTVNKIPGVNIGTISKIAVPEMATGGIVNSATLAVVGEQGKEAIMPLENNLQWLDKLAGMLNERMGGSNPIVLQVDGKTFAQISCDSINSLTRQRGSLPLKLV